MVWLLLLGNPWWSSSWTTVNPLSAARNNTFSGGVASPQTAGWVAGGNPSSSATEEYDGTNWTGGGNLNTGRQAGGGAGSLTTAIAMTGIYPGVISNLTELYDGTSWSSTATTSTSREDAKGAGTSASAFIAGGRNPTVLSATEEYTGTGPVTKTITVS
jgi:hypothetical protein